MEKNDPHAMHRRNFLGSIATGAAALGFLSIAPLTAKAGTTEFPLPEGGSDADEWFNQIKGKHRIIYDCPEPHPHPHQMMPFAWAKVFLLTNAATGTPVKDSNVVMVLRHNTIPYAMNSSLWEKYKFGEVFKIDDPKTGKPATRNAFWQPAPGDFKVPGIGPVPIGINELQADGVMFGVCDMAMTVFSAVVADMMKMEAIAVKKDWVAGLLPGVQVMPSGVWAVGRAQEHGCAYCFAG